MIRKPKITKINKRNKVLFNMILSTIGDKFNVHCNTTMKHYIKEPTFLLFFLYVMCSVVWTTTISSSSYFISIVLIDGWTIGVADIQYSNKISIHIHNIRYTYLESKWNFNRLHCLTILHIQMTHDGSIK